jgi:hypothetical protein
MAELSPDGKKSPNLKRKDDDRWYEIEMEWDEFFELAKDRDNWELSEDLDKVCVMAGCGCSYDDQEKQGEFDKPNGMYTLDTADKLFGAETFVLCDECVDSCDEYIEWWLTNMSEDYRNDSTFDTLMVDISYLRPYTQDRLRGTKQAKTKDE